MIADIPSPIHIQQLQKTMAFPSFLKPHLWDHRIKNLQNIDGYDSTWFNHPKGLSIPWNFLFFCFLSHRATPSHHPFLRDFLYKPSILGYPHQWKPAIFIPSFSAGVKAPSGPNFVEAPRRWANLHAPRDAHSKVAKWGDSDSNFWVR